MTNSLKISNELYLVSQPVPKAIKTTELRFKSTNYVVILDCSYSMVGDLPQLREQLKRKVPKLLRKDDTLSIVWFSGRGQYGTLLEAEPVANLTDLKTIEDAIDRWIRPVGATGFKEPLEEASKVVDRIYKKHVGSVFSLFFMSDGWDNQWSRAEIIEAAKNVGSKVSSTTIVEYGYYADRQLLTQMAQETGGNHIFAEDFDRYAPSFEAALVKENTGAPKVKVDVSKPDGFVFTVANGDVIAHSIESSKVEVPSDVGSLYYLSRSKVGALRGLNEISSLQPIIYAAVALYAQRMDSNTVYELLRCVGDVRFVNLFASCFGKQKYSEFVELSKKAVFDSTLWGVEGYDSNAVPKEDAFTVLDLLYVLSSDSDNHILVDSKDFKYSRVSRGRVDVNETLTSDEQEEIENLTASLKGLKDPKKVKEITEQIAAISNKPKPLEFKAETVKEGYPINGLTFNEERANVSFRVKKNGNVDISDRAAADKNPAFLGTVPNWIDTFVYRNYTIIKDGLVNIERLPVRLTAGTIRLLKQTGMPDDIIVGFEGEEDEKTRARAVKASQGRPVNVVFDLKKLPIINRKMVKSVSAEKIFNLEYELTKSRAAQKVFNDYKKNLFPRTSKGWVESYGQEATDWLKEQGLTDYSGFNPKSIQAEAKDFYMSKEVSVSLKGYSTLPSVKDVSTKMEKGAKLSGPAALMAPTIAAMDHVINVQKLQGDELEQFIDGKQKDSVDRTRELISDMATQKFSIIVGQTWPFPTLDENTLTFTTSDGTSLTGTLKMTEKEVKI